MGQVKECRPRRPASSLPLVEVWKQGEGREGGRRREKESRAKTNVGEQTCGSLFGEMTENKMRDESNWGPGEREDEEEAEA